MAEQNQRQTGVLVTDEPGEPPQRVDGGAMPALAEAAELPGAAVLAEAGAAVPAVIVGVHGETVGGERLDEGGVAAGVLADAVQQLHDSAGRRAGGVHVVDDRDPVCVDELGHGPSLGAARSPAFL